MSEYVNADLVRRVIESPRSKEQMINILKGLPTTDVKEVIHAYWYKAKNGDFWCSHCRSGYSQQPKPMGKPTFRYCPICGAIMDAIERSENEQIC